MGKEETCVYAQVAGEELEIGITSCSTLKHVLPAGPAHARASAQHREGLPYIRLRKGTNAPAERWCVQVALTCAGQMIQGVRFLQGLAVFIPWLPSLRDQGM